MLLKFKSLSKFEQSIFSTHEVPNRKKTEKKLHKMSETLSEFKYNPIWVNEDHGTCLVTTQCLNRKLVKGAIYRVTLECQAYEKFALINVVDYKLVTKPKKGKVLAFADSDDEDPNISDDGSDSQ